MPQHDVELLRPKEALRLARERLARISKAISDAAALKAEDLCAKASDDLAGYQAKGK